MTAPWTEPVGTPLLRLRAAAEPDRPALLRMLTDPDTRRYLGGPVDESVVRAARTRTLGATWGSFLIEVDGAVAGSCSLDRDRGELEVSYQLLPEFRGRGLATEALGALLDWAARCCPEDHVIAVTQAANAPSLRLLDRLGFTERERFVEFDAPQVLLAAPLPRRAGPAG